MKSFLAFDLGASSGRAILGSIENGKLVLKEVHRFPNNGRVVDGDLRWDINGLRDELAAGISKAFAVSSPASMGIDTWGVDYVLFSPGSREPVEEPFTYRDGRTDRIRPEAFARVPQAELYRHTGIQDMAFNTVFQLVAHLKRDPETLARTTFLHIPDALGYMLGGSFDTEYTDASTSGLVDAEKRDWDFAITDRLGLPRTLFPKIVPPGSPGGALSPEWAKKLGVPQLPIVKVGSHDTASAVAAVPDTTGEEFAYMSLGTWALLGAEAATPCLTEAAAKAHFTNEGGLDRTIRFLTNIMGCWLFQECRRAWQEAGNDLSFSDMEKLAAKVEALRFRIDPKSEEFLAPGGMPDRIAAAAAKRGPRPETPGEIVRCVYDSLALCVRDELRTLEGLRSAKYPALHIVGGGIQAELLMQLIADACGIPVLAGPVEATAIGNLLAQMIAAGEVADLAAARKLVAASFEVKKYLPRDDMTRRFAQV
jgi:rhamnulokinase